ncbi:MAG: histidinol-phosphate transaminase [Eubacteriales bacterium]|nr:histidinol-phosphate transaminase [Eubacteriales bacterium]
MGTRSIHGGDIYRNRVRIDFSVNTNPLGMPEGVKEALLGAAERCSVYPDPAAERLSEAVGSAIGVRKENLVFGNGASELFVAAAHALRPKKILIPVPSFYGYEHAAKACGAEISYVPLKEEKDFLPDGELLRALTPEVDLLFLANPNNPTGQRTGRELLKELLARCKDNGTTVVLDECFIEFCGEEHSRFNGLEEYPNLIVVRAFTKSCAIPGVRLGYLACADAFLTESIRDQLPEWNLSVFAQEAGIACARQRGFLDRTRAYVRQERRFLEEGLLRLGLRPVPGEANFLLFFGPTALYERLLERGILIRDCRNFRGLTQGYYRIAVRTREENKILLREIGECIGSDRTFAAGGNREEKL